MRLLPIPIAVPVSIYIRDGFLTNPRRIVARKRLDLGDVVSAPHLEQRVNYMPGNKRVRELPNELRCQMRTGGVPKKHHEALPSPLGFDVANDPQETVLKI